MKTEKSTDTSERLLGMRYHRADKFWLLLAAASFIFGVVVSSGIVGMGMLILAREYLKLAEDT